MSTIYGSEFIKTGEIPIRYILLNPYDIATVKSASFNGQVYRKVLSEFELERLKDPKTGYDKEVLDGRLKLLYRILFLDLLIFLVQIQTIPFCKPDH